MRKMTSVTLGVAASLLAARNAHAVTPVCSAIPGGIPTVWIENGDTQEPLMKQLGARLIASATPLRIVYKNEPTCTLANDMYVMPHNTIKNDTRTIRYIPTAAELPGWNPTMAAPACTADAAGNAIELAIGATYLSSCTALPAKPATVGVTGGPIEAYGFIVPPAGGQVAITAEEGYLAFGFPQATGQAKPWTDDAFKFIRAATASTALTASAAVGLTATQLKGTVPGTNLSSDVVSAVVNSTNIEPTIGLLGVDVADQVRGQVKFLAFKSFGQRYAYFPDSTFGSFDKQNVRDGHYVPWAATAYVLDVDAGGAPVDAAAQRVRDLVLGTATSDDVDGVGAVAASALVPKCAMTVSRNFDGDQLTLYSDPAPCECAFEAKVPQGTTSCKTCTGPTDPVCGAGACRFGYCEAR